MSIQELRPGRKIDYARVEVGECENWNTKNFRGKIVYPTLKQSRNITYAWIEGGNQIAYPEIKADRKDWICRDLD